MLDRRPEALLLDEPTANLDAESGARVEAVIQRYREENYAALIWVGHDPKQRERVANAQLHIEAGRLSAA